MEEFDGKLKRLLFIYNPRSGRGVIRIHLGDIIKVFEDAGYMVTVYEMRYHDDAPWIVEHEGKAYDRIVCAGGDGTLNAIVSGAMRVAPEDRRPIGFIATGSTNDTKKSYKLPTNFVYAAKLAVNGEPFATDVGTLNDKTFVYVASFGELSAVSGFTPQTAKNLLGHAAYITEGLKVLLKMPSHVVKVTYDGQTVSDDYFLGMVTNSTSVGGFTTVIGPNVDLQDGYYELMLFKKPADLAEMMKEIDAVLKPGGTAGGLVTRIKAKEIIFESEEELQWVVDGEDAGKHKVVEVRNHNKAIEIISGLVKK